MTNRLPSIGKQQQEPMDDKQQTRPLHPNKLVHAKKQSSRFDVFLQSWRTIPEDAQTQPKQVKPGCNFSPKLRRRRASLSNMRAIIPKHLAVATDKDSIEYLTNTHRNTLSEVTEQSQEAVHERFMRERGIVNIRKPARLELERLEPCDASPSVAANRDVSRAHLAAPTDSGLVPACSARFRIAVDAEGASTMAPTHSQLRKCRSM